MVVEAVLIGGVVCGVFLLLIWWQSPEAADVSPFRATKDEEREQGRQNREAWEDHERKILDAVQRFRGRS